MRHRNPMKGTFRRAGAKAKISQRTRREFLRVGGAGIVGTALSNCATPMTDPPTSTDPDLDITAFAGYLWVIDASNAVDQVLPGELPYDLDDDDVICCYDGNGELVTQSFEINLDPNTTPTEPEVSYSSTSDYLEVDMTVFEDFEECYYDENNPNNDPPYEVANETVGSIGING